ncbi:reverse transcriptase domain-containing protein [Tanacetum coccineum]|uniref:RNA-directed DNA polymerase n=1 Tax=Tanacetum coccineum TaxID=301880 RepID=A0ABQ5AJK4_9ASTR
MGTTAAGRNISLPPECQNATPRMYHHNAPINSSTIQKQSVCLDSLSSTLQEILATKHQLNLPQPAPLVGVPSKENLNRYCDYHNEKGHSTNDCFHLKRQLEIALESGKLNHLVKDVRQRGKVRQQINGPQKAKVINMVQCHPPDRKTKTTMTDEEWMNVPIIFPPVPARDLLEEALVVEAEVEGYLVRRIHIDEGASIEIMFEQCFNMLHLSIRSKLVETQTTVSGFSGEQVKPLGKIELDVCFGGAGRCRRTIMKFTVILAPSPYNIILGCPGLKQLRAIPSTIHRMMKFPTPWGVATIVSQTPVVFECRREGKKQTVEPPESVKTQDNISPTEQVLINPAFPEQLVADGSWRMCIDFKNINSACPKDYYPLPEIDSMIEAVMSFPLKCFLDAYKGYHPVQMAEEDEEKTAFYMDQGKQARLPLDRKSRKRFPRTQEDDFRPAGPNNPLPKETLFIYLAASKEAVSAVLLAVRQGKQHPVHYVSRTLHDAERNYAPLEKMALALRHVSRRLRRYFEAHPITVITDQPIKQVLNKADTSGRLAPYSVELAAYNITYEPRSAIKGQVLADFINEIPVGSDAVMPRQTQYTVDHNKDCKEEWVLYTDGASSAKGSGAGLVLISPTKTEYTYALRLNFESTNNQAEYEALLAGLRIAKKMGNIPRNKNQKADVLSKLASVAFNHLTKEVLVETLDMSLTDMKEINAVVEEEGETWMTPIINCLERGIWPEDQHEARIL